MSIKDTLKAIRALGVPVKYSAAFKEYRVGKDEASAYYTEDSADAIGTAKLFVKQ